ncbi:hypothetical protein [Defluviimonas salinarum]|uniref:Acid phosphatase n=1 Tax=Defluviimonas salinarum TaxID=2992147 RepID=A0ABT3J4A2_9RHOB|nr:hypothetical protein [Defluviimonas salinarum]MCW3782503.1 hypothetical protein [Defluviimonas salinarum]
MCKLRIGLVAAFSLLSLAAPVLAETGSLTGSPPAEILEVIRGGARYLPPDFDTRVPPPYSAGDLEARREVIDLLILQRDARTPRQVALAVAESMPDHTAMDWFELGGLLPPEEELPAIWSYLRVVQDEVRFFALRDSWHWQRPLPAELDPAVETIVPAAPQPPYPSDHSARAASIAYALALINPDCTLAYFELSREIAARREIAGVNYASDSSAGEVLAGSVVEALILGGGLDEMIAEAKGELRRKGWAYLQCGA